MTNSTRVWETGLIFKTLAGSWLYGTNTDASDIDIRGVCCMPKEALLGLSPFEQYQPEKSTARHPTSDEEVPADTVIYGLNKFAQLALDCNPNIIEILFAPTIGVTCYQTSVNWDFFLAHRKSFISKKAKFTFLGYATSQYKRMETHHLWMTKTAPSEPVVEDFGGRRIETGETKWLDDQRHQDYRSAHNQWRQYQDWLTNRNPKRHALEVEFGCDTKNMSHLCRLTLQGIELLQTGKITLPRPEAKWLLEVKGGLMTYEQGLIWFDDQKKILDKVFEDSNLPEQPCKDVVEQIVIKINTEYLQTI